MRKEIADEIKAYINANIWWKDTLGGLAFIVDSDGMKYPIEKLTPVDCQTDPQDLAPNSKKKSIMYFEDKGTTVEKGTSNWDFFSTNLTLIGWVNYNLINKTKYNIEDYMLEVMDVIPNHISTTNAKGCTIYVTGTRINNVFENYTYDIDKQYFMYPYGAFAIDFLITYRVMKGCKIPVVSNPTPC